MRTATSKAAVLVAAAVSGVVGMALSTAARADAETTSVSATLPTAPFTAHSTDLARLAQRFNPGDPYFQQVASNFAAFAQRFHPTDPYFQQTAP